MSPIYVRPEREQAEHDRLIRFLQAKYSRKFQVAINPGDERVAPVKVTNVTHFPDIVLLDDKRLAGVVEIETAASVNNLETMAKWVPFSRARVPFHLYVPVQGYEAAVRLAEAHQVKAAEIWTYRPASDGFDLVRMFVDATVAARPARPVPKPAPKPAAKQAGKPAKAKKTAAKRVAKAASPAKATSRAGKPAARRSTGSATAHKATRARKPTAAKASKTAKRAVGAKKGKSARKGR